MRDTAIKSLVVLVLVALLLAVLVGFVFSIIDSVDKYAEEAGIATFLVILIGGFLTDRA